MTRTHATPNTSNALALVALLAVLLGSSATHAQESEQPVTDLTDQELTTELLIEKLTPQVERPRGARSLTPPTCKKYRKQVSRGLRPATVSENIAITVEFASDSANLTSQAKRELDKLGAALESSVLDDCCFWIQGHTDSQNTDDYNQTLSEARAQSVVDYIAREFGVEAERLIQQGFGENEPLKTNDTPEGRQKNRRVQVTNLGYQTAEGGP